MSLRFFDVSRFGKQFEHLFLRAHFARETYFRLLMPELLPDETPAIEPTPVPLIIPMDPDIEPDTRMPEEMKTAA